MKADYLKKSKLPDKPGVYFFLKGKEIIYIGKATSLRSRTRSYFSKDLIKTRGPVTVDMVFKADGLKWEATPSVLEALILEANLIKKHQPYYNIKEKDDKSWNYVVITKETLPKVIIVRERNLVKEDYKNIYGPFTKGTQLIEALKIIRKIFPFLDNKSKNYLEFYRQINLVPDLENRQMYLENIKNIKLFFSGKKKKILQNLKKEMAKYAKAREFEKAGEVKRQIFALQHINDVSLLKEENYRLKGDGAFRIEAYDIAHMSGKNMVGVMTVVENGQVVKSEYKKFKIRTQAGANDVGALEEVLKRRLAHTEWNYPNLIVVDGGIAQINIAEKTLRNLKVGAPVVSVLKDERHKPKALQGNGQMAKDNKNAILLANSEAHRFAISYHKNMRGKNFLKTQ